MKGFTERSTRRNHGRGRLADTGLDKDAEAQGNDAKSGVLQAEETASMALGASDMSYRGGFEP